MKSIIVIPARMNSQRFPGKPLKKILGKPMIAHVIDKAKKSNAGPVLVACCDQEIANFAKEYKTEYVMTDPEFNSGTDRVYAAISEYDKKKYYDLVINLQSDIPGIEPKSIKILFNLAKTRQSDIATLASLIRNKKLINDPNVVKVVISKKGESIYFSRSKIPYGSSSFYEHIGIYAFKRSILENFVKLGPSMLETTEKLEQLRALEEGIKIDIALINKAPVGIDTPNDIDILMNELKLGDKI